MQSHEIRKTLSAFANSTPEGHYSVLFLGVTDKGMVKGITDSPDKLQKTIAKIAADECYPPIPVDIQVIEPEGKTVVAVVVGHSKNRPHFTGHAYKRVGSESKKATAEEYNEFVLDRIDKIRRILQERGKTISVEWKNAGIAGAIGGTIAFNDRDYMISSCDAHVLSIVDGASQETIPVPIGDVTISIDANRRRMKLVMAVPRPVRPRDFQQVTAGMARLAQGLRPPGS
jgi:hypothetical protein